MSTLSDLAANVRKDEFGYPEQPKKSRLPEGAIVGGAGLGVLGAMGVNNAVNMPKRTTEAIKVGNRRFSEAKDKARSAKATYDSKSKLNPARGSYRAAVERANATAITEARTLRAHKNIARNMPKARLRAGIGGGAMMAGGAGLAALGSAMRKKRDDYSAA